LQVCQGVKEKKFHIFSSFFIFFDFLHYLYIKDSKLRQKKDRAALLPQRSSAACGP